MERTPEPGLALAQETGLEQRIRALMDDSRSHAPVSRSLSVVLLLMALIVTGSFMIVQASITPTDDINLSESANADSQDAANDDSTLEIAGTVVGPNGQPILGSKLFVLHNGLGSSYVTEISKPAVISKSDGSFSFRINPKDFDGNDGGWSQAQLVATKEGYGLAADGIFLFESTGRGVEAADGIMRSYRSARMIGNKRTLSLTDDSAPIEGRLLDTANQPLAGARVSVLDLIGGEVSAMDRWEAEAGTDSQAWILVDGEMRRNLNLNWGRVFDSFLLPIVTDAEGRFAVRGLGSNRVARLAIRHPRCEFQEIQVRTRDGEILNTRKQILDEQLGTVRFAMEPCYPRQFEIAISPSIPLIGTVKDARTGQPIPGALVSTGSDRVHNLYATGSRAVTDVNGLYELHGFVSRAVEDSLIPDLDVVTITPPDGSPYFPLRVRPHVDLKEPGHKLDVSLVSGVFIRGQVRKKSTDDAVMGTVYGAPANDNSNAEELLKLGATLKTHARTDSEGNFALLATPGKFHMGCRAMKSNEFILLGGHLGQKAPTLPGYLMNYVDEIVVGETGLDDQEVQLVPQRTIEIEVLDRSGKPVSEGNNGILSYRNPGTLSGSSFHAIIIPFTRSEVVILYDYMTGDAAKVTVAADDTRVKLQLAQTATIRGRLIAEDGSPMVGYVSSGPELISKIRPEDVAKGIFLGSPVTDLEGRFEMVGIVGQNYAFQMIGLNKEYSEVIRVEVNSPDLIDLGDITMPTK
jgi:protocatechuate 3,4-dioxygenase beta subunit